FLFTEYILGLDGSVYIALFVSAVLTYFISKYFKLDIELKIKKWPLIIALLIFFVPSMLWDIQNGWYDAEGNFYSESDRTQHVSYVNQLLVSKRLPIDDPYMYGKKVVYSLAPELTTVFLCKMFGADPYTIFKILFPLTRFIFIVLLLNIFSSIKHKKLGFLMFVIFSAIMSNMVSYAGWVSWTVGHITLLWLLNVLLQKKKEKEEKYGFLNSVMAFQYLPLTVLFSFIHFIQRIAEKDYKKAVNFAVVTVALSSPWIAMFLSSGFDSALSDVNPMNTETIYRFAFTMAIFGAVLFTCNKHKKLNTMAPYLLLFFAWIMLGLLKVHWISISLVLLIAMNIVLRAYEKNKWANYGLFCVLLEVLYLTLGTKMFYAVKLERMSAFILIIGAIQLISRYKNKKISALLIAMTVILGAYELYSLLSWDAESFLSMDFTENKVHKYDAMAYDWINENKIEGKVFLVSYYDNFVFCPLSALTPNKMYYCSKMIAITQGYDYSGFVDTIENLKLYPEKISELIGVDYIFISSEQVGEYMNMIDYCVSNEACSIAYSKWATIIEVSQ
ncbi:MAG: hypothetical protein PHH82_04735, partial [Candidatus ainarchaeum sp.]|nr:hypothetical protein [Candidatus ainarchaeum sp.]